MGWRTLATATDNRAFQAYTFWTFHSSFPPFMVNAFHIGSQPGHERTGLHHLTRPVIAVIYCNNFQYGQGDKIQHLCHGCPVYSQAQVPAFKFTSPEQKAKSATSSEPRSDRGSAGIELGRYKSAVKWFGQTLYHIVKEQGFLRNNWIINECRQCFMKDFIRNTVDV